MRVKLKKNLLKLLMQHYGNYRITPDGSRTVLMNDLDYFDKKILSYKLVEDDYWEEYEQHQETFELLQEFIALSFCDKDKVPNQVKVLLMMNDIDIDKSRA